MLTFFFTNCMFPYESRHTNSLTLEYMKVDLLANFFHKIVCFCMNCIIKIHGCSNDEGFFFLKKRKEKSMFLS